MLPPLYTLFAGAELVGRLYGDEPFGVFRAGRAPLLLCPLAFARLELFSRRWEDELLTYVERAADLEALVVELGIAGLRVHPGEVRLGPAMRRF